MGCSILNMLYDYDEDDNHVFVSVRQNEQQETAIKALESLCENSTDEAQVLTALRLVAKKIPRILIVFQFYFFAASS